jgi:hypothetical protein
MKNKISDMYDFKCEVVHHEKEEPTVITYNLYRSEYMEFYKGTETTKAEFTIVKYGDKFSCFVYAIDDNKKKGVKDEFRGNLLWGFGKPLTEMDMYSKLASYTNMDDVKKDFGL